MTLEFSDVSGQPPTLKDVQEAQAVVAKAMVLWIFKFPPEFAVQIPNIHRCLALLESILEDGDRG